jgi:Uma2 family endonuclease
MALQLNKWLITVDEFERMIEAGVYGEDDRIELIDGELVTMATIGLRHSAGVRNGNGALSRLGDRAVVDIQNPLDLRPYGRPEPDIMVLRPPRSLYQTRLPTPADVLLIVEIAETSLAIDRDVKIPRYAQAGIPEAWLIDVTNGLIRLYRGPQADGYKIIQTVLRGGTIAPLAFPELTLAADDLLPPE